VYCIYVSNFINHIGCSGHIGWYHWYGLCCAPSPTSNWSIEVTWQAHYGWCTREATWATYLSYTLG